MSFTEDELPEYSTKLYYHNVLSDKITKLEAPMHSINEGFKNIASSFWQISGKSMLVIVNQRWFLLKSICATNLLFWFIDHQIPIYSLQSESNDRWSMNAWLTAKLMNKLIYRIRRCPVPPLSSPPVKLEESWSLKKKFDKIFFVKNYAFEFTVNKIFLFLFVFPI